MTHYGCFDPELVIQPGCTEEVSQILAYANQEHLPVTTRGAGTGLCGGCVPIHGGIVMSMMRMNKILEIDEQTMNAVLQPGVLLMEIIEEAANHNLLYAPDPGEKSASVGGNVMTNAGGMREMCIRDRYRSGADPACFRRQHHGSDSEHQSSSAVCDGAL